MNLLELATYFLGLPYEPLDGLSGPFHDLMLGPDCWRVIGPDPKIATVQMPRDLALAELDDRGEGHPDAILFRLGGGLAECCLAARRNWRQVNQDGLRLLAHLAAGRELTTAELQDRVVGRGGEDPAARFRQIKTRLNKDLRHLTGSVADFVLAPHQRTHLVRLADGVIFYGAVEGDSLSVSHASRRRA